MKERITRTLESMKFAESCKIAMKMLLDMFPRDATVGVGDSATVRQIGILDELGRRGTRVLNAFTPELTTDERKVSMREHILRRALTSDVFIASSNTVTVDGKLVNIDAAGNRIAGLTFGPKKY